MSKKNQAKDDNGLLIREKKENMLNYSHNQEKCGQFNNGCSKTKYQILKK